MAAGTIRWSGTFTLSANGPGDTATATETIASFATTDKVVVTPSHTSLQNINDVKGAFTCQIVKSTGSFTAYADRTQLPNDIVFDYVVLTVST
jgi:hypothetical protein